MLILNVYVLALHGVLSRVTETSFLSKKQNIPFSDEQWFSNTGTYLSSLWAIDLNPMVVVIHQGDSKCNEENDYLTDEHD